MRKIPLLYIVTFIFCPSKQERSQEWVTDEENKEYARQDGVYLKGEKNPTAKLTEEDVRFIRQNYKAGDLEFGKIALAEKFKVSDVTITNIVTFKSWKHVQ